MNKLDLLFDGGQTSMENILLKEISDKKILVTGASGIIGTYFLYSLHYAAETLQIPLKVYAVVNRGIPEHLKTFEENNFVEFIVGDLTNDCVSQKLPKVDIIIHAATYGQPGKFMEFPATTIKLNTTVTMFLLEKVLLNGGKFLFLSTSELYCGLVTSPFNENQIGTTSPEHPRSCYIESKRCGETIVNIFRQQGVHAVSARLSLAYGPGTMKGDKRVINNFIEKAIVSKEIRLIDDGSAMRTYCYITDAVNMMWRILLEGKKAVYNIGGISRISILNLAELVGQQCKVPVIKGEKKENFLMGAPDDVWSDISLYLSEFGERNFVDIYTGVQRTIEWQTKIYKR